MKIRTFAAALVMAGAPALLLAQQQPAVRDRAPQRGEWQDRRGGQGGEALLRFRQQLGLSDAQVSRLQGIQQRMQERNAPVVQRIDAARRQAGLPEIRRRGEGGEGQQRAMRGRRGGRGQDGARPQPTEQQRQAFQRFREQVRPLHEQLRQNRQSAMQEARSVLTEQQRQQVQRLMQEHRGQRGRRGDARGQRQDRRGGEHQGHGTSKS